jgi:hypothetical protein
MSDPARVDPFAGDLDLSDFKPTPAKKPSVRKDAIREVSEANNFPSRAPERPKPAKAAVVVQRRRRTGRNMQFNIKATPETIARFTALADKHGLVFGELLERALEAFEGAGAQDSSALAPAPGTVG